MEAGFFLPGEGSEPEALSPMSEAGPPILPASQKMQVFRPCAWEPAEASKAVDQCHSCSPALRDRPIPMTIDGGVCHRAQREALAVGENAARYGGRQANPVWNVVPVLSAAVSTAGVAYLAYQLA